MPTIIETIEKEFEAEFHFLNEDPSGTFSDAKSFLHTALLRAYESGKEEGEIKNNDTLK